MSATDQFAYTPPMPRFDQWDDYRWKVNATNFLGCEACGSSVASQQERFCSPECARACEAGSEGGEGASR